MITPRIYVYKITFEEIPHYYYGSHKEKKFGEYYMGSPVTHKWMWDFYTPQIQILQFFEFSAEGYKEARQVENRLIRPFYNDDVYCLNEWCGGHHSLDICSKAGEKGGKIAGVKNRDNKTGVCGLTFEQRSENGKIGGRKTYENRSGWFALTTEQRKENSKKVGQKSYENGTALFSQTPEQLRENARKAGQKNKENGTGVCGMSLEKRREVGKKSGQQAYENKIGIHKMTPEERIEASKKGGKASSSQKWKCIETGFVSSPGPLSLYQKARGIDTSKRIRIQ
jgi:hypothetical protein